jgi:hypothetical protein
LNDQALLKDGGESLSNSGHLKNQPWSLIADSVSPWFANYKRLLMTLKQKTAPDAASQPQADDCFNPYMYLLLLGNMTLSIRDAVYG